MIAASSDCCSGDGGISMVIETSDRVKLVGVLLSTRLSLEAVSTMFVARINENAFATEQGSADVKPMISVIVETASISFPDNTS
ncbi:hypothetical protein M3J09_009740 [Ascochyta lentis]